MATSGFLVVFLAFLTVYTHGQDINIAISDTEVALGDSVTLRCQLTGAGVVNMIYWYKKQGDAELLLATNHIPDPAVNIERYLFDVEEGVDGDVFFLLNIQGVEYADSGEFGCESPSVAEQGRKYVGLTVIQGVTGIRLFSMPGNDSSQPTLKEYADGELVDFKDGDLYYFKCLTTGSNPAPNMRITLGSENVTDNFYGEETSATSGDNAPFNTVVYTKFLGSADPIQVHYIGNAQEFRCSAWVDGTEPTSIHIVPVLKFAPVLDCPDAVRVPIDTEDLDLQCVVRAEPICKDVEWTIYRKDMTNITLDPINNPTWGNLYATSKPGEIADELVVTLNIEHVFIEHFRDYILTATTELGISEAVISLERDEAAESVVGSANGLLASLSLLLAAMSGGALYAWL